MQSPRGAPFPSSNLMSYVTTMWASKALTSLAAKNRSGLATKCGRLYRVRIDSFISMGGTGWEGDKCACGNSHTVGKCQRAQRETGHDHWGKVHAYQRSVLALLGKESDEWMVRPSICWVSLKKLSILCILSIPAFVQPSSATTASTSRRRGSIYPGFARR